MELFHKILVTSSKGGIGKSTVALGVAAALSREGRRVLLVDCDAGNRCLDLMLGVEDAVLYDLSDVYEDRCAAEQAFLSCPNLPNLVFCAAPADPFFDLDKERLTRALRALAEASHAEFVICDTAGLGDTVRAIAADFADGALIVATQQPASIRSAERTAMFVEEMGGIPARLIISCFEERSAEDGIRAGLIEIIDGTHVRTLGVVPKDRTLLLAQETGRMPGEKSRAGTAFANIAKRILGEDVRLFSGMRKIRTKRVL